MHSESKIAAVIIISYKPLSDINFARYTGIVAKCPGLAGTVPEFGPMSRLCPGLPDFTALSRNPARLHNWRCGTSINSV